MFCEKCGKQIDENAKFCSNCGFNLHQSTEDNSLLQPYQEQNVKKKKKKKISICSILSIVFGAIGILFFCLGGTFLVVVFLTIITTILAIIGFISGKDKRKISKVISLIVTLISITISIIWIVTSSTLFSFIDNIIGDKNSTPVCSHSYSFKETEATCLYGGYATYQCSKCYETKRQYEGALGHDWHNKKCNRCNLCSHSYSYKGTEATCSTGGYDTYQCSICNDIKKEYKSALGHSWSNNICERCGTEKELKLDPQNNNILTIDRINIDINSVGGVETNITYTNHTDKQIAYIYFTIKYYDRMGYAAYCSIKDTAVQRLKVTGPIEAGKTDTSYWDPIIYNSATAVSQPQKIEIIFTDGTKQSFTCTGKYWYTGSYYGGELHD